jgi:signal transduction histidine kinase
MHLVCDPDRLAQVLTNLLTNAITHTAGGEIMVRLRLDGDEALLTVSDDGRGIPQDRMDLIFEPGRQFVDHEPGGRSRGSGLGLHITKGIVEAHGGRIWVESSSGHGSTFYITLPLTPSTEAAPSEAMAGVAN